MRGVRAYNRLLVEAVAGGKADDVVGAATFAGTACLLKSRCTSTHREAIVGFSHMLIIQHKAVSATAASTATLHRRSGHASATASVLLGFGSSVFTFASHLRRITTGPPAVAVALDGAFDGNTAGRRERVTDAVLSIVSIRAPSLLTTPSLLCQHSLLRQLISG